MNRFASPLSEHIFYSEIQISNAMLEADIRVEERQKALDKLQVMKPSTHPRTDTASNTEAVAEEVTMTPAYSQDQVMAAMTSFGLPFSTQSDIIAKLIETGPFTTLMSKKLSDKLGISSKYFKNNCTNTDVLDDGVLEEEDILKACRQRGVPKNVFDGILETAKYHMFERRRLENVVRCAVSDIRVADYGKKVRLALADDPEWKTLTDMRTFHDSVGDKKAILVLNGQAVICDDVPIDIDNHSREEKTHV